MQTEQVLFSLPLEKLEPIFKKWFSDILASQISPAPTPTPEQSDRIFTAKEAAELLRTTPGEVYQLVHKRKIPFFKKGKLYFSEKELRAWLAESRHQTIKEIQSESLAALSATTGKH